jgi:hypothetical protein
MLADNKPLTGQKGLYTLTAPDQHSNKIILKPVNSTDKVQTVNVVLEGANKLVAKGKLIVLRSDDPDKNNS